MLVYSANGELGDALVERIRTMTKEVEVGDEFTRQGRQDDDLRRVRRARQGHRRPAAHLQRLARPARRHRRGRAQQGRRDPGARGRGRPRARPHRPAPRRGPGRRRQVRRGARHASAAAVAAAATAARAASAAAATASATAAAAPAARVTARAAAAAATPSVASSATASGPDPVAADPRAGEGHRLTTLDSGLRVVTERDGLACAPSRSASGSGRARSASPPTRRGSRTCSSTCCSAAPTATGRWRSTSSSTAMGAELNAGTGKETTSVYARVLDRHLDRALDVMADMVWRPKFDPSDLDAEREIVIEEIAMYDDDPQDKVFDVLGEAVFGDAPAGPRDHRDGRRSSAASTPAPLHAFHAERYVPSERRRRRRGLRRPRRARRDGPPRGRRAQRRDRAPGARRAVAAGAAPCRFVAKDTEQYHVCLGGAGHRARRRAALRAARARQRARAARRPRGCSRRCASSAGWPTRSTASSRCYAGTGQVGLYLGTRPDNVKHGAGRRRRRARPLPRDPASRRGARPGQARTSRAGCCSRSESTTARMNRLGSSVLGGMPSAHVDEVDERIDAVTRRGPARAERRTAGPVAPERRRRRRRRGRRSAPRWSRSSGAVAA